MTDRLYLAVDVCISDQARKAGGLAGMGGGMEVQRRENCGTEHRTREKHDWEKRAMIYERVFPVFCAQFAVYQ